MNTAVMFSSATDLWETPQDFFDNLNAEFNFTTDVCALPENAKCKYYFTPEVDGLSVAWAGRCWMNPPYGREIGKWVKKAHDEVKRGVPLVVCLLPARTDTKWFHDYIYGQAEIRFIRGRLKFGGSKNSAPFPSMVVIFYKKATWTRQDKINKVAHFCAATDCGNCKAEHVCADVGYGTVFFRWSEASETTLDAMLAAIDAAEAALKDAHKPGGEQE